MTIGTIRSFPSLTWTSRFGLLLAGSLMMVIAATSPALGVQQQFNNGGVNSVTTQIGRVAITNGTQLDVLNNGWIRTSSGSSDILAATVSDTSVLSFGTGSMLSASTGAGDSTGVILNQDAQLLVSGGDLGVSTGDGDSTGVILNQNAQLLLSGGQIGVSGIGNSTAVLLNQNAQLIVTGGGIFSSTGGGGVNNGIVANDQSSLEFFTGADISSPRINANDDSTVDISGGDYSFPRFVANGNASFNISGGDFSQLVYTVNDSSNFTISGGTTGGPTPTLNANDQGTFFLLGDNFNLPLGEVAATSGTITGILEDGNSFSYNFQRGSNASIILAIPEPSSLVVLIAGGLLGLRRRRA